MFATQKTWNKGAGFFLGSYHVYAKDEILSNGYGGYCHVNLRPSATVKQRMHYSHLPHLRPTSSGFFITNKRHADHRVRLIEAMNNEVLIPKLPMWDRFRPETSLSLPLLKTRFGQIIKSWKTGLTIGGTESVTSIQNTSQGENPAGRPLVARAAVGAAILKTHDDSAQTWSEQETADSSGSKSKIQNTSKVSVRMVSQAAVEAARAILKAHDDSDETWPDQETDETWPDRETADSSHSKPKMSQSDPGKMHGTKQWDLQKGATSAAHLVRSFIAQGRQCEQRDMSFIPPLRPQNEKGTLNIETKQGRLVTVEEALKSYRPGTADERTTVSEYGSLKWGRGCRPRRPSPRLLSKAKKALKNQERIHGHRPLDMRLQDARETVLVPSQEAPGEAQSPTPRRPTMISRTAGEDEQRIHEPQPDASEIRQSTQKPGSAPFQQAPREDSRSRSPWRASRPRPQEGDKTFATQGPPPRSSQPTTRPLAFVQSWIL